MKHKTILKRAIYLTVLLVLGLQLSEIPVFALSVTDIESILNGTAYYDPNAGSTTASSACATNEDGTTGTVTTETGTGPLFGLTFPDVANPQDLVTRINNYISNNQPSSPLNGLGNDFVAAGQKFNVNPAMLVGIAQKESSLGTANQPIVTTDFNSFGIFGEFPNQQTQYPETIDGNGSKVPDFGSFAQSPFGAADYISAGWLVAGGEWYPATSILDLMTHFTPPTPQASTEETLAVMHSILDGIAETGTTATPAAPAAVATPTPTTPTTPAAPVADTQLDLSSIVAKYGLESVEVKQIGGSILGSADPTQPPTEPASVMKLIIADVFLHTNPDLTKAAVITSADLYGGPGTGAGTPDSPTAGQKGLTLGDMLQEMLQDTSSDTDANVLIDASGGLAAVNASAKSLGYTGTTIVSYYNHNGGSNVTDVADLTTAMENVYTAAGNDYGAAQDALRSAGTVNHWHITPAPEANKWGGTNDVTGNSGVFDIGSNKVIITLYVDEGQGTGGTKVQDATQDILALLNANTTIFSPGSSSGPQCDSSSSYTAGANGYDLSGTNAMAHFYQCDPAWGDQPYGPKYAGDPSETICQTGCGITALAMVVDTLAGVNETPLTLANKYGNTYHVDKGTSFGLWPVAASDYGLKYTDLGTDLNAAAAIIRQGGLVIISVDAGYFTTEAHLMVLRAVDDQGNFYLADPNGPNNPRMDENVPFTPTFLQTQGNMLELFAFTRS